MKTFIFFFGPPASGKGTQIELLMKKASFKIISIGKLLREERKKRSEIANLIKLHLDKGELVPDEIVELIIDKELKKIGANEKIIFDGFPRNQNQLTLLDNRLKKISSKDDKIYAIYVRIDSQEIKRRLGGRRSCECGSTYHIEFNTPKKTGVCDSCEKKLFTRADDNSRVISERIKIFQTEFGPIMSYWKKKNILIEINGEQDIKVVSADIENELRDIKIIK